MLRVGTTRSSVMLPGLCEARLSSAAAPFQPLPPGALVGPARLEGEQGPLLPVCSAWSPERHPSITLAMVTSGSRPQCPCAPRTCLCASQRYRTSWAVPPRRRSECQLRGTPPPGF